VTPMEVSVAQQLPALTANTIEVHTEEDLARKIESGRSLRVKLGIDPTASDIHLGFAVVLRKLRQFQEHGHTAVLILGDFTAQVGDPSGRSATRPRLSAEEIDAHAATYVDQIQQILLPEPLEVRRNSEWLATMGIEDVLRLTARTTVARMLERNDFAQRYASGSPISVMELLYPLLQGWDSVMVQADVELGGTDQLFNVLVGRQLQEQEGQEPQVVMTLPLLEGFTGGEKMSKSLGNYVGVTEPPAEMFGKLMRVPDDLMPQYFALTTGWDTDRVEHVSAELADGRRAPVAAKRLLARTVVDLYHGPGAGEGAEAEFDRVFKAHDAPSQVPEVIVPAGELGDGGVPVARLLARAGLVGSNREGRRMITQGAVRIDGDAVGDVEAELAPTEIDGRLFQVGKRKYARIRVQE
jgi:tyrosyl-tRNA synthetase